mmetsp:Transcript_8840/g.16004  ORF Transcript_8840/g.16004 Transcript_8840/m.16004 type:complete len:112 (+) Transcript_8840:255-590(+)
MCRNTFGGNDYLPTMALHYTNDPKCNFLALCRNENCRAVAAVANIKKVNPSMGCIEAVRTCRHYHNNGLSFTLLRSMLKDARNSSYKKVWACRHVPSSPTRQCVESLTSYK